MKSKLLSVFYYGYLAGVPYLLECDTHGHFITPVISIYMTLYIPCRTTGYLHAHVRVLRDMSVKVTSLHTSIIDAPYTVGLEISAVECC